MVYGERVVSLEGLPPLKNWPSGLDMWPRAVAESLGSTVSLGPLIEPESVDEVVEVVRLASAHRACLTVAGGGSNVVGMTRAGGCCAVLDLKRLKSVGPLMEDYLVVHSMAGARVSEVEEYARRRGYTLSYTPQSIELATIGGSIATLGSGSYQPCIGNVEDVVAYIDVVFPSLGLRRLGSLVNPRGWIGPGVKHLVMGSEGGLGVVVGAGLRVRPAPRYSMGAGYIVGSFSEGVDKSRRLVAEGVASQVRLIDSDEASLTLGVDSPVVLALVESQEPRSLELKVSLVESIMGSKGSQDMYDEWLRERGRYQGSLELALSSGMIIDTIDVASGWDRMTLINREVKKSLSRIEGVVMVMSHASHFYPRGGSLYFIVIARRDASVIDSVWGAALEVVSRLGGSINHHHGIGRQKLEWALR